MAATTGVAIGAAWAAPWRALELALTLRTLTVHLACGWSSVGSNDLGRCVVGFTVDAGAARIVRWRLVQPQLHVNRQRWLPETKWTTHGTTFDKGSIITRA